MASSSSPKDLIFHPSVAKFNVIHQDFLTTLNTKISTPLDGLATGAVVFSQHHEPRIPPRILLVQRSSTDSMPNLWEIPGGAVDEGETLLAGAAREVYEESGLMVKRISRLLAHDESEGERDGVEGGYIFSTRRGMKIVKFTFVVDVEDSSTLKLDPEEHQDYVWATEAECRAKKVVRIGQDGKRDVDLLFTTVAQEAAILKAFSEQTV